MKQKLLNLISFAAIVLLSVFSANAQGAVNSDRSDQPQIKNRPIKIIKKLPPSTDVFGRCFRSEGFDHLKIVLRVTFHSSGKVTDIEQVAMSGCRQFDEEAIRVARKIKFEPAFKDGEAVTTTKTVVYEGGIR